jgi:hypothetical protein
VDLAALLALSNARFRAWRAYGVPVAGRWLHLGGGTVLDLQCTTCQRRPTHLIRLHPDQHDPKALREKERRWLGWFGLHGCPHLAPLLAEEEPHELAALLALELLAGDPPP